MKKKQIFWIVVAVVIVAVIVFFKVVPVWASLTGIVAFGCGIIAGWWGKIFRDKQLKQ